MIKLKNYQPVGHDILLKVRQVHTSPKGILMPSPQQDRVMQVLKTGPLVTHLKPGDWVLIGPSGQGLDLPMVDGKELVYTIQTSVHNVVGTYDKDENEELVFMAGETVSPPESVGPQNIIDNEGIELGSFIKEQKAEA